MRVTEHNTIAVSGATYPHGHRMDTGIGPISLRIGTRSQPQMIRVWKGKHALLAIEQPNDKDNFTFIKVLYLRNGVRKPSFVAGYVFHKAKQYRRPDNVVEVRIKKRYCDSFPHPIPIGKYTGSCMYDVDGGFAVFTLQAMTLRKEPEPQKPRTIITPGDKEYDQSIRDIKRAFPRANELER